MRVIGLTAGIGCGASTVAKILKQKGFEVIEADKIARSIMKPNSLVWQKIVRVFGDGVLDNNFEIDRAKLGLIAFASKKSIERLNKITHPSIIKEIGKRLKKLEEQKVGLVVLDAPLLVEAGLLDIVDFLVVVKADFETRVKRIVVRDFFSREEAVKRIDAQIPLEEKIGVADFVIDNSGGIEETEKQVRELVEKLKGAKRNE